MDIHRTKWTIDLQNKMCYGLKYERVKIIGGIVMKKIILSLAFCVLGFVTLSSPAEAAKKATSFSLTPATTTVTRKSVKVSIKVNKKAKIKEIRYRAGKVKKKANKYWKRAKSITKKKYFYAPYNGWYSVRLKNKAGKYTVRNIQIRCIDKTAPSVKTSYTVANKVGTVSVSAWDSNGIAYIGYQKGWLQSKRKTDYVAMKTGQKTFQVTTPGYYTVCVKDGVGNTYLAYQYVELWKNLWNLKPFDRWGGSNYKGTMKDRWGNAITNPICVEASNEDQGYIEYYLGGKYNKFSGNLIRSDDTYDSDKTWVQIIADGVVLYQSKKMDYKTKPISFDITINHAKYVKIVAFSEKWDSGGYMLLTDTKVYN